MLFENYVVRVRINMRGALYSSYYSNYEKLVLAGVAHNAKFNGSNERRKAENCQGKKLSW